MVIGGDWWGSGRGWDPIKHRKQVKLESLDMVTMGSQSLTKIAILQREYARNKNISNPVSVKG